MKNLRWIIPAGALVCAAWMMEAANNIDGKTVLTGQNAFADSASLKPGRARRITPADLPKRLRGAMERAWCYPVVANGKLYIRDLNMLWCYEIREGKGTE